MLVLKNSEKNRRINITNLTPELYEALVREGEPRGESVQATVVRIVADRLLSTQISVNADMRSTQSRHNSDTRVKFVPPTDEQMGEEWKAKGYHFDLPTFKAHYRANGWKVGKNLMKSWEQAMVGWESRWREDQTKRPEQRRLNYAEQRVADMDAALDRIRAEGRGVGGDAGEGKGRTVDGGTIEGLRHQLGGPVK